MRGRKPKPRHLKVIAGTLRPSRDVPAPAAAAPGELVPPGWMLEEPGPKAKKTERERRAAELRYFRQLAAALEEIGCASPTFESAVVLASRTLADIDELSQQLAAEGMTFEKEDVNGEPMLRAHPAAQLRMQAIAQARALLSELGLTPTSLAKASKTKNKQAGNGFKELG